MRHNVPQRSSKLSDSSDPPRPPEETGPPEQTGPFERTTAVVTGSSSGIGRCIAASLAAKGCDRQVVHYRRNIGGAQQTAALIGDGAIVAAADFSLAADREQFVDAAYDHLGRIDTWVFNAGVDILTSENRELSFEQKLSKLIAVDVVGTIDLARKVAERMRTAINDALNNDASGELANPAQTSTGPSQRLPPNQTSAGPPIPSLTFIGWDQAERGMEGDAGQLFGTTKAAIMAFAMSLAQELSPHIRVNVVAPGWIKTAWGNTTDDYWDRRAKSQSLMNRWGSVEDVANAVIYAATPQHTFLTGQILEINGGWNRKF